MKSLFRSFFLTVVTFLCVALYVASKEKPVVIKGPTVVAFFTPVTEAELDKNPDTNEALADFQVYAERVRGQLEGMGIAFEEVYATSFVVKCGAKTMRFRPKIGVGYYFTAPGKSPHVEYGVRTDVDILQVAKDQFHPTSKWLLINALTAYRVTDHSFRFGDLPGVFYTDAKWRVYF